MELFRDVLEYIPEQAIVDNSIKKNKLFKVLNNFIIKHGLEKEEIFYVSLSGGVDSMVLATLLHLWNQYCNQNQGNIKCLHINYNNRKETCQEEEFIRTWCNLNHFSLEILNFGEYQRGKIERNEYEKETRAKRYQFYQEHTDKIFIGHHANDVAENVFCNIMKGRNILDLSVISEKSVNMGVNILRPFRDFPKKDIFDFAHRYSVPYFKDTTPDWSNRGKLRRRIFTSIEDQFGSGSQNALYEFAQQSDQMNDIFVKFILEPYLEQIVKGKYGFIFPLSKVREMPSLFWLTTFMKVFHNVGISMPKRKNVESFVERINKSFEGEIIFKEGFVSLLFLVDGEYYLFMVDESYLNIFKNLKKQEHTTIAELRSEGVIFKKQESENSLNIKFLEKAEPFLNGELTTGEDIKEDDKIFAFSGKRRGSIFWLGTLLHKFGTSLGRL